MTSGRYLREVQYRDSSNLAARANLHARYSTAAVPWFSWVARQVTWSHTARVLEVGCGPGWLWEQARADLPDELVVTLTDLSSGMLGEALTRVSPYFHAVHGAAVDAGCLPFAEASFDVVLANHMLYHVAQPALAVRELARVSRHSGTLVAATNGPAHMREIDQVTAEVFGEREQRKYSDRFGAHNGAQLLETQFDRVEWRSYHDDLVCTDPDDVLAYVLSYPPGDQADDAARERLRAVISARFAAQGAMRITRESGAFVCHTA
jgi:ubiquinone/menaquinone biosynthesis C-methylase UbiE